ncbi:N-acetyltransferase [Halobacteriales archaeon SW_7_68_16]|nr:MAG: N-acetyltransferase [Halobacteriales archaeon SW_7_68_16]
MAYLTGDAIELEPIDAAVDRHVEVYRRSRVDPTMRATGWYGDPLSVRAARETIREWEDGDGNALAIVPTEGDGDGTAVGWCRITMQDDRARRVDAGCYVLPDWQGRGYGTEATRLLTGFAFRELNAHKIEVSTQADNEATAAMLTDLQFTHEARLRDRLFKGGEYVDMDLWSVTETEWD